VFNRHAQLPAVALSQHVPSKHPARIELAPRPWQGRVQPQHLGRIWQIELSKNRRDRRSEVGGQKNLFISDLPPPTSHLFPSGAGESRTHNVLLKRQVQLPFCFNPAYLASPGIASWATRESNPARRAYKTRQVHQTVVAQFVVPLSWLRSDSNAHQFA
jgi:hypothetical protein